MCYSLAVYMQALSKILLFAAAWEFGKGRLHAELFSVRSRVTITCVKDQGSGESIVTLACSLQWQSACCLPGQKCTRGATRLES